MSENLEGNRSPHQKQNMFLQNETNKHKKWPEFNNEKTMNFQTRPDKKTTCIFSCLKVHLFHVWNMVVGLKFMFFHFWNLVISYSVLLPPALVHFICSSFFVCGFKKADLEMKTNKEINIAENNEKKHDKWKHQKYENEKHVFAISTTWPGRLWNLQC